MRHQHAVERAVEIGLPEIEKVDELGETRREVVVLPDIALQQLGMIGQAIKNLGRGQREPLDLTFEGGVGHGSPAISRFFRICSDLPSLNQSSWFVETNSSAISAI